MAPHRQNICWKLMTLGADMKTAVCDLCKTELAYFKCGNTILLRHLRNKHIFELAHYEEITRPQSMVAVNFSTEVKQGPSHAATPNAISSEDVTVLATELEVRRHLETASLSTDAIPLDYWRDHCASLPWLSPIARDVLSIPATSVPSERLFFKADACKKRNDVFKLKQRLSRPEVQERQYQNIANN